MYIYIHIYIYIWSPRAFPGVSSLSPPNVSVKNHPTTETKKPKNQSSTENAGTVLVFWIFVFLVFWFFGSLVLWFFGFLVFWFFGSFVLWFFGFLVFWFFGFLVLWFFVFLLYWLFGFIVERVIFQKNPKNQKTKEPKNQKNKKPKNKRTKKPKNQKTKKPKNQKTKKPKLFQHSPWSFGFLVFWFRSSGGSSRTRSEGSNSIPRKKQIDTYTNTKLTLIPR